jgi:hypothetical protein
MKTWILFSSNKDSFQNVWTTIFLHILYWILLNFLCRTKKKEGGGGGGGRKYKIKKKKKKNKK